jgi:hypothetical protein
VRGLKEGVIGGAEQQAVEQPLLEELEGVGRGVLGEQGGVDVLEQIVQLRVLAGHCHCQECPQLLDTSLGPIDPQPAASPLHKLAHKLVPPKQGPCLPLPDHPHHQLVGPVPLHLLAEELALPHTPDDVVHALLNEGLAGDVGRAEDGAGRDCLQVVGRYESREGT